MILMVHLLFLLADSPELRDDKPPTGQRRHKNKVPADKEKVPNEFPFRSGKSKPGRESKVDYKALSEGKLLDQSFNKSWKRKNKSSSYEVSVNPQFGPSIVFICLVVLIYIYIYRVKLLYKLCLSIE